MQFHRQSILIELYDIEIQFGGVEEMRQEDYVQSKLDEGSKVTAMTSSNCSIAQNRQVVESWPPENTTTALLFIYITSILYFFT